MCWKDVGWFTGCNDKLMSSSSERTGAGAARDPGARNLLVIGEDPRIHFLLVFAQQSRSRERSPSGLLWVRAGRLD